MGKVIVTMVDNHILITLFDQNRPELFQVFPKPDKESLIGNIYVGRVQECVKGIDAAFVAISPKQKVFLHINDPQNLVLLNRTCDGHLKQGDNLLVQVDRLDQGNKLPSASNDIDLIGQYVICHLYKKGITYSKKLSMGKVAELKEALSQHPIEGRRKYGFTIRTNTGTLSDITPVLQEMNDFLTVASKISETASFRKEYSCVYRAKPEYLSFIEGIPLDRYEEILTDEEEIFTELEQYLPASRIRFYDDYDYPLFKLYSLKTHLEQALGKKVWLPCGGCLVIEPTEAMTVIDVNSGKGSDQKGKTKEQVAFLTNLEAAKEIARQLRLRNCVGMIMVDFINMEDPEHKQELLDKMNSYVQKDLQQCRVIDMTPLGIVEITRKKIHQPLKEMLDIRMI